MSDTIDVLQDQILKAVRAAKESKRLYDIKLQERITLQRHVDEAFHNWQNAKKTIEDCVRALEPLVGAP